MKSTEKLAKDECYPVGITQQFQSFETLVEDVILDYKFFPPYCEFFCRWHWKILPKCYKVCSEVKDLKNFDHNCSMILRFEAVYQVLAHLTGATICDDVLSFDDASSKCLSEKELSTISYLSYYIFEIFYRGICFSKPCYFGSLYIISSV